MTKLYNINAEQDTINLARKIAPLINKGDVLALYGDLGTGKTFFTKYFCKALGVDEQVTSPSFVLINQYKARELVIYHVDLYRLHSEEDLLSLGLDEFLEDAVTVIEWPELAEMYFDNSTIRMRFHYERGERTVTIEADRLIPDSPD